MRCAHRGAVTADAILLEAGANPDLPTLDNTTPLMAAAAGGHVEVARVLI